jgi:hypothetical protein
MMKNIFFIAVLCFGFSVSAQKSSDPAYKIRAKSRGVSLTFQGKTHSLDVGEHIDAARITGTELLFASEKDGFRYLLIDVSGWSREKQNDRQCGAGTESNLIWIKLDAVWKIRDVKSVRYQSCWSGIDLDEPFKITRDALSFSFDNVRDKLRVRVFYEAKDPEKGFQIRETSLTDH